MHNCLTGTYRHARSSRRPFRPATDRMAWTRWSSTIWRSFSSQTTRQPSSGRFSVGLIIVISSVADPDPPDPHVFGPPGSGSTSQRYGSGSGSFYHHAQIVRKILIPTIFWLFLTFYLWKTMYLYLQKVLSRIKKLVFAGILKVNDENSRIRIH